MTSDNQNIDLKTVDSFGDEWSRFDQKDLSEQEHQHLFNCYFSIFPWESLPDHSEGFDMGCGSGRWAVKVAPRVGKLNCIDPSKDALEVARSTLKDANNASFINAGANDMPLKPESQDFGYSLGVLHHIPDTEAAMRACVELLKPGAPFLVYLYYRFDNRPGWFRALWKTSEMVRAVISRIPAALKNISTGFIALTVYWPLARTAWLAEKLGLDMKNFPLYFYRNTSFYSMRTDSPDRFGTPLEQRFTRSEIKSMMEKCGLTDVTFSEGAPFWCAVGLKQK